MGILDLIKNIFTNGKKRPRIIVLDLDKVYKGPEPLEVGLYNRNEPITDTDIEIEVNNVPYQRKTDQNGVAKLNINLGVGQYKAHIRFKETEEYNSTNAYAYINVNPQIQTNDLSMSYKDGSKFVATLLDNDNKPIPYVNVEFKINGVKYNKTSDDKGNAVLSINLNQGTYIIETKVNNVIKTNKIIIKEPEIKTDKHFGYWVFGKDMINVNLDNLKKNGVTDIFLNYYALQSHGKDKVIQWIKDAAPINVHIWMQCFYDGEWHNPVDTDLNKKIEEAKSYGEISGIAGVHLDYLRYPGNAHKTNGSSEAITNFVRKVRDIIPKNIMLSCAVMPEKETKYYYGQDIPELNKIVDVIIPMQYKGNYNAGSNWLASTTKIFSDVSNIWSGLQAYKSDNDTTLLSISELTNDIKTCLDNKANGVLLFRYGLSPNINFKEFQPSSGKIATKMEGTDINMTYKDGTQYQCAVYDNKGRIAVPVNITVNGKTYTKTPDNSGLYKLNINLNPGNYTINSSFAGNDIYLGSSVTNNITINAPKTEEPKQESVVLHDYFTKQGGGYLGQKTGYTCGPHSLMQCIYRLTGEDVSEMELASVAGTTTQGTDHSGLATALAWFNKKYGYNLKMTWKNFSEVGFEGTQQLINNGACFHHILYRNQYGHYEVPKWTSGDPIYVLNSLGNQCGNGYCGYVESRSRSKHQGYINGISQPSVCIITR